MRMSERKCEYFQDENAGYCSKCDAITVDYGIEPDAENYRCDECGELSLMGIDNAVIMGHIEIGVDR